MLLRYALHVFIARARPTERVIVMVSTNGSHRGNCDKREKRRGRGERHELKKSAYVVYFVCVCVCFSFSALERRPRTRFILDDLNVIVSLALVLFLGCSFKILVQNSLIVYVYIYLGFMCKSGYIVAAQVLPRSTFCSRQPNCCT